MAHVYPSSRTAETAVKIVAAARPPWLEQARRLFREYGDSLDVDLSFQNFDDELATLPGVYGTRRGSLLVAAADAVALGCVGLRELDSVTAELKRLYVRPTARGVGVGSALTGAALAAAEEREYRYVVLDTLATMGAAQRLYAEFGFVETAPYTDNPVSGTRFLRLDLKRRR